MGKTAVGRIDETLKFLQKTTVAPATLRDEVYTFAKAYADQFLVDKKSSFTASVSSGMSTKNYADTKADWGDKAIRTERRAMALLWTAMSNLERAGQAMTMASGRVEDALLAVMKKAKATADMAKGISAGNQDILLIDFMGRPAEFLSHNVVVIYGIKADAQPTTNIGRFGFYFQASKDRYVFECPCKVPGAHLFDAVNVPAVLWSSVPGRGSNAAAGSFAGIQGTPLASTVKVMLTTQFTGCTFCVNDTGGTVHAAHIAPSNAAGKKDGETLHSIDPTVLAEQVCATGDFAAARGAPTMRVYGRDKGKQTFTNGYLYKTGSHGSKNWMTVIGFRDDTTGWSLYTQSNAEDHPKPKRVRQVFPAPHESVS
ncbi:MAG: hypothetical protein ABI696_12085 [Rubrivivax sp.]